MFSLGVVISAVVSAERFFITQNACFNLRQLLVLLSGWVGRPAAIRQEQHCSHDPQKWGCLCLYKVFASFISVVTYKGKLNISICLKRCFLPVLAIAFKHLSTVLLNHLYFKHRCSWKRINSHELKKCDKFWCTMLLHASCRKRKLDTLGCDEAQQDFLK